ncbi:DinB family protein [Paenibacillus sp. sgz302251]|uniref:DinB family protein n=1 Tax=Paenibacillus sp. sgz302251 TaxID=3414493 RepID=UPI003C7C4432
MQAVKEIKDLLFEELELIVRTSSNLIRKISPQHWHYRPRENMRSLLELVHHLVAVPSTDLLILQEKSEQEIRALEGAISADLDQEQLIGWMTAGMEDVKKYMKELPDEEFLHKKTTPFYLEHGSVQAKWLIEIVTHAQHHRGQLFTYLKEQGYEVNMFDLY